MRIQNPRVRSCAILQLLRCFFFVFLLDTFFLFTFECVLQCVLQVNKKKMQRKNRNDHLNHWTILLLVMRQLLNYTEFYYF